METDILLTSPSFSIDRGKTSSSSAPTVPVTLVNLLLNQLHSPGPPLAKDGTNYHQWAHNFCHFLSIHGYRQFIMDLPPLVGDSSLSD